MSTLTAHERAILEAIRNADTAAQAFSLIPSDWHMFVSQDPDQGEACASFVPPGVPQDHRLRRIVNESGLATGRGLTTLDAFRDAAYHTLRLTNNIHREAPAPDEPAPTQNPIQGPAAP